MVGAVESRRNYADDFVRGEGSNVKRNEEDKQENIKILSHLLSVLCVLYIANRRASLAQSEVRQ
jgi:hypothetical protein